MAVIFSASTDTFSANRTSRIIGPLLRWFKPDVSPETIQAVQTVVRKGAHMAEYAVLALLLWRAIDKPARDRVAIWNGRHAAAAFAIATIYAATDEFHQMFVPSRGAQFGDVLLDSAGAALGLIALWLAGRWKKIW
jgi:VanZ family protein